MGKLERRATALLEQAAESVQTSQERSQRKDTFFGNSGMVTLGIREKPRRVDLSDSDREGSM